MATKLQYHKIKNVPLEVCTVEQKLAYNLSYNSDLYSYLKLYNMAETGVQKSEIIHDYIRLCMKRFSFIDTKVKHNIDGIFCCLNAGMENYFNSDNYYLTSYDEIGKMFPANYL